MGWDAALGDLHHGLLDRAAALGDFQHWLLDRAEQVVASFGGAEDALALAGRTGRGHLQRGDRIDRVVQLVGAVLHRPGPFVEARLLRRFFDRP